MRILLKLIIILTFMIAGFCFFMAGFHFGFTDDVAAVKSMEIMLVNS